MEASERPILPFIPASEAPPSPETNADAAVEEQQQNRSQDVDTCRICRGEGSVEEPLFYPCKCSGSIKFVHQDCLMEWLAHSQKKYCELCKTPFHFTKLYSPHMPKRLPTSVFLRKAILHVLAHLWTWVRGLIVGCVWLICVPWLMRSMWRMMFWIADAGWARETHYMSSLYSAVADNAVIAVEDISHTSEALDTNLKLPSILNITSQTLDMSQEPLMFKLAKGLFMTVVAPLRRSDPSALQANVTINPLVARMLEQGQSSILSDVHALKTLGVPPVVRRTIIDVLEGQIITLSVVILCILVFLIREWVVQQQPVVDLGAADADNALAQAGGGARNAANDAIADTDEVAQVENIAIAQEVDFPIDDSLEATSSYESSLRELRDSLDKLDTARNMMARLEDDLEDGVDGLPSPLHERVRELREKTALLEQRILDNVLEQRMSLQDLTDVVESPEASLDLLKEMFDRLEAKKLTTNLNAAPGGDEATASSSQTRPGMPARGVSSVATAIIRNIEESKAEHVADLDPSETSLHDQDEDGRGSSGSSWQQVSVSEQTPQRNVGLHLGRASKPVKGENSTPEIGDDVSWISTAGSTSERTADEEDAPENPFAPVGSITQESDGGHEGPENEAPVLHPEPERSLGIIANITDWLWGDIEGGVLHDTNDREEFEGADDEHVVMDLAAEAPFVPFAGAQPVPGGRQVEAPGNPPRNDGQAAVDQQIDLPLQVDGPIFQPHGDGDRGDIPMDAAADADADAIEDAEDLEGILELIGMQGPLAGLIQNAIFSSILVTLSIGLCVFAPYVWGKLVLLHVAEPSLLYKVPLRTATVIADLAIDTTITVAGYLFWSITELYRLCMTLLSVDISQRQSYQMVLDIYRHAQGAFERLKSGVYATQELETGDFLYLSMACHTALYVVEDWVASELLFVLDSVRAVLHTIAAGDVTHLATQMKGASLGFASITWSALKAIWSVVVAFYSTGSIPISMGTPLIVPDDPMLTYWSARDRTVAILTGYAAVAFICAAYVRVAPITSSPRGRRVESHIVEACLQAGGVLKVILIISIEMIAFPLFCGFLLDVALMPLFESASLSSRLTFTLSSPWTSGFVHWFVGTCYMFHFALFVSMCRRILRDGVLYFIRDPDDPTFHPIRDVLERNVITQLRKIAFSAIVYGALIIVCLGGIVWGLWCTSDKVLPIHWSSTGSNIEFPLDILFYNFLTPFIVYHAKPSVGITKMYELWFKFVARGLRLSDFLFRDPNIDEQGHWVRRTWMAWLTLRTNRDLTTEDIDRAATSEGKFDQKALDDGVVRFVPDGKFVRAPASDQVRIPKGDPVFVPVDHRNKRLDGKTDDEGVHAASSNLVTKVYIPPWFRVRIGAFGVAVWIFAAATGLSVTIVPLLFGRYLLSSTLSPKEYVNDIYAFSLGIYILGGVLYGAIHRNVIGAWIRDTIIPSDGGRKLLARSWSALQRLASMLYVYSALAIGLPLINAVLLEVYILMPMHFLFDASEHHVMHLVQDWTLGVLYVRIGMRMFLFDENSRPARAIRQVFARGYLHPDARRATRFFILPAAFSFALLMGVPFASAVIANKTYFRYAEDEEKIVVMRLAYPVASAAVLASLLARRLTQAGGRWRARIRDEVYLVGERLHNFGERKEKSKGKEKTKSGMVDTATA